MSLRKPLLFIAFSFVITNSATAEETTIACQSYQKAKVAHESKAKSCAEKKATVESLQAKFDAKEKELKGGSLKPAQIRRALLRERYTLIRARISASSTCKQAERLKKNSAVKEKKCTASIKPSPTPTPTPTPTPKPTKTPADCRTTPTPDGCRNYVRLPVSNDGCSVGFSCTRYYETSNPDICGSVENRYYYTSAEYTAAMSLALNPANSPGAVPVVDDAGYDDRLGGLFSFAVNKTFGCNFVPDGQLR
jgi:hypothetical protein